MGIKGKKGIEYVLQLSDNGNINQLQEKTIEILSERLTGYGYAAKQFTFNSVPNNQLKVVIETVDDSERVKKLLTERGYFSMQECFNKEEIFTDNSAETIDKLLQSEFQRKVDALQQTGDTQAAADVEKNVQTLFSRLFEVSKKGDFAELGLASAKDTAQINRYLVNTHIRNLFPNNATFIWSRSPNQYSEHKNQFTLYAAKVPANEDEYLNNNDISEIRSDKDYNNLPIVSLVFKESGHKKLEKLSDRNIDKAILITLNNQVVSAPIVREKLTGGAAQISGNFTETETMDLVNMLSKKHLPVEIELLSAKVKDAKEK